MKALAWDIGGANIKRLLLDSSANAVSSDVFYFPMWQRKADLEDFLRKKNIKADIVGVTMTAELCDVFGSKGEGVRYIVGICEKVFKSPYYLSIDGKLQRKDEIDDYLALAASNWAASIKYLEAKYKRGMLLDVGSTTTDIVPFGYPELKDFLRGATDLERLRKGFLVYTGILRTPVSAIVHRVPLREGFTRVSSEIFAISADVYNVLGLLDHYRCTTPDGGGKTPQDSMRRLARLLCADIGELTEEEIRYICDYVYQKQAGDIAEALKEVNEGYGLKKPRVYVCGSGVTLGMRACKIARLDAVNLAEATDAYDNIPCLGIAEMLIGKV